MPTRATRDRDRLRGEAGLLERSLELDAIDELLDAGADVDRALLISGPPRAW